MLERIAVPSSQPGYCRQLTPGGWRLRPGTLCDTCRGTGIMRLRQGGRVACVTCDGGGMLVDYKAEEALTS